MKRCLIIGAMLVALGSTIVGHHGDAGRYEETLTTVSGTVVELQLVNPHSILVVETKEANGRSIRWRGELGSPAVLKGWCWNNTILKTGDKVTMKGRRLKNGQPFMTLSEQARVIDATGKELFRGNEPGQPDPPGPCSGRGQR